MKLFIAPLFAAFLTAGTPAPVATPSSAPSVAPSPSPATSATPEPMVPIGDDKVKLHDFADFMAKTLAIYLPLKDNPVVGDVVGKSEKEMPANDHNYYYAGNAVKDGKPHITVWITNGLDKQREIFGMTAASALGLMDAGLANDAFEQLYAKAKAADLAAGPTAKDPWAHREDLADNIAAMIMVIMSK